MPAGIDLFRKDEIFDKNAKIILGCLLVFLFALFSFLSYSGYFENNRRKEVMEENFSGKIIEKNVDYKNHGDITLKLSDSTTLSGYFPKQKIDFFVNDSLVKDKKSIYMQLYRKGSEVIKINMLEK